MSSVIQELLEDDITLNPDYIRTRAVDWKDRVSRLFDDVVSWFPELLEDRSGTVVMDEPIMRKFAVAPVLLPVLRLSNEVGQLARFVPNGLWVIGTNGRLNLSTAKGRFIIIDRSDYGSPACWEMSPSLRRFESGPVSRTILSQAMH